MTTHRLITLHVNLMSSFDVFCLNSWICKARWGSMVHVFNHFHMASYLQLEVTDREHCERWKFKYTHSFKVQFIEFIYCHDRFPEQAMAHKHSEYDPLIHNIQNKGWRTNPLITITVGVRGAIHEHSLEQRIKLKLPKSSIRSLMKNLHHNAIKYLTYLFLNKRKLDNKRKPVPLP